MNARNQTLNKNKIHFGFHFSFFVIRRGSRNDKGSTWTVQVARGGPRVSRKCVFSQTHKRDVTVWRLLVAFIASKGDIYGSGRGSLRVVVTLIERSGRNSILITTATAAARARITRM